MKIDLKNKETAEKVEELKRKHGALRLLTNEGHSVIIRRPSEMEWEVFGAMADDPKISGIQRFRHFLDTVTVYPPQADTAAMYASAPGLMNVFGSDAIAFSGATGTSSEKKDL